MSTTCPGAGAGWGVAGLLRNHHASSCMYEYYLPSCGRGLGRCGLLDVAPGKAIVTVTVVGAGAGLGPLAAAVAVAVAMAVAVSAAAVAVAVAAAEAAAAAAALAMAVAAFTARSSQP
eukprot:357588-Chlamydomonas_euryale.AAC.1